MKQFGLILVILVLMLSVVGTQAQDTVELVMGSWRTEDIEQWDQIIAAFEAVHPEISVSFEPTLNTEYDSALLAALEGGTGPDLITCRPFTSVTTLYDAGYLADVTDVPGMEHFNDVARSGWITDDGSTVFCVPMASVIHGFI